MKLTTITTAILATLFYSTYLEGQTLEPIKIDSFYCFNPVQVRYIAKEVYQSPIKDSIIKAQDRYISNLDSSLTVKDSIIVTQGTIIKNDSIKIEGYKDIVRLKEQVNKLEVKRLKKKNRSLIIICVVKLGIFLGSFFIK